MWTLSCSLQKLHIFTLYLNLWQIILINADVTFEVVSIDAADLSVRLFTEAKSEAQCGMECFNQAKDCKAFVFDTCADERCTLYQSISLNEFGTEVYAISKPAMATQKLELDDGVNASMSTEYCDGCFAAHKAIDGVYNNHDQPAHTLYELSPWLQISLAKEDGIKGVKIWNRCLSFVEICQRLNNVLISVSVDRDEEGFGVRGTKSACSYSPGTQPAVRMHLCFDAMIGRYVRLTMVEGNNYLNIMELEVHV